MNKVPLSWSRVLRLSVIKTLLPAAAVISLGAGVAFAQSGGSGQTKWVATWATSMQGPASLGNSTATQSGLFNAYTPQQNLTFPFPKLDTEGANNQTIRTIVKPDLWGNTMRFRFSNVYGNKPVTLGPVRVGRQEYSGIVLNGTNTQVTFNGGSPNVTIPVGQEIWSDAVTLSWVTDPNSQLVEGRNLAVSYAVQGTSGPVTHHSVAFTTNYISPPNSGDHTNENLDFSYPYTSTSWYFLSGVDVMAPADTQVICAYGDSITDGTFTTLNGNDRWSNFLSRRLHEAYDGRVSVVNEGIGGNRVTGAAGGAGQNAQDRLDRDVLGLSGLSSVIWLEGINDLGSGAQPASVVIAGYQNVVSRLHAKGVRVIGATILSSFKPDQNFTSTTSPLNAFGLGAAYGGPETYAKVLTVNDYIRTSNLFDGVVDMYAATLNPATSALKPEFTVSSTDLSANSIDFLHPNRAGQLTMANSISLSLVAPHPSFFSGEIPLGAGSVDRAGVSYLTFANGNVFGYYSYAFFPYLYHFDFGFVYFQDAGNGNAYLYDFASQTWFYTGAALWPYMYDFNLNAWLLYQADPNRPGHYTSNPRRFFNFATNTIITK